MSDKHIHEYLIERIEAFPAVALTKIYKSPEGLFYATIAYPPSHEHLQADFSSCAETEAMARETCKAKLVRDLRGKGKYGPHFDNYVLRYWYQPYWEGRESML